VLESDSADTVQGKVEKGCDVCARPSTELHSFSFSFMRVSLVVMALILWVLNLFGVMSVV
jgi:hypothetical protein